MNYTTTKNEILDADHEYKLCRLETERGRAVKMGDPVSYRPNETWVIDGGKAPHKPSSSGKVWIRCLDQNPRSLGITSRELFPHAVGMKWQRV